MDLKDQGNKVLVGLKDKFNFLFRLINRIGSLEKFVIYINLNKGKFISLLKDIDEEIEESRLIGTLNKYAYFIDGMRGDFRIIVAYRGEKASYGEDFNEIEEICLELMNLVEKEALELQKRIAEENKIMELSHKCKIDDLTGLYNRGAFDKLYRKIYEKSKQENRNFSILMIDIDNFKNVNDSYGHQMGDKILKKVAEKIKVNVRRDDIVARYGGEEIIIILVEIDEAEAIVIAERIRDSIATLNTEGVRVTISIGISNLINDPVDDGDRLIYIADQRLYKAKELGKNMVKGMGGI